jgi:hypothetical protein
VLVWDCLHDNVSANECPTVEEWDWPLGMQSRGGMAGASLARYLAVRLGLPMAGTSIAMYLAARLRLLRGGEIRTLCLGALPARWLSHGPLLSLDHFHYLFICIASSFLLPLYLHGFFILF